MYVQPSCKILHTIYQTSGVLIMRPVRGFREPGEWGSKRPGSQEQDAKMTKEQGAEEINLGSMEHRVCHKIMVFYTIEIFRLASQKYTNCTLQD